MKFNRPNLDDVLLTGGVIAGALYFTLLLTLMFGTPITGYIGCQTTTSWIASQQAGEPKDAGVPLNLLCTAFTMTGPAQIAGLVTSNLIDQTDDVRTPYQVEHDLP